MASGTVCLGCRVRFRRLLLRQGQVGGAGKQTAGPVEQPQRVILGKGVRPPLGGAKQEPAVQVLVLVHPVDEQGY